MYRRLSGRLFHVPMLILLCLLAVMAGLRYLSGQDPRAAALLLTLAIIFYLAYGYFVVPRIYTRPAGRLIEGLQSLAKGNTDVAWRDGFEGELLEIRTALESLAGTLRAAGVSGESGLIPQARSAGLPVPFESVASQVSCAARGIGEALEMMKKGCGSQVNSDVLSALEDAVRGARNLSLISESMQELSRLEKPDALSPEALRVCELMKEVESETAALTESWGNALTMACDERLLGKQVHTDRRCLKELVRALVMEGVAACGEGTVTVISSLQSREENEYLEICIAHTARRFDGDGSERRPSESSPLHPESVVLCLARRSASLLGGSLEFESTPGKGSVVTIMLPVPVMSPE